MVRVRGMKRLRVGLVLASVWGLAAPTALAAGEEVSLRETTCSWSLMIEEYRAALKTGSPVLKRYLRTMLKEAALSMPIDLLQEAYDNEREPAVLEALGVALATKSSNTDNPKLIRSVLTRAVKDSDPSLRAAAVRGLRGIGSVDAIAKNSDVATYEQLIRDSSPEVREAVVGNIVEENAKVYFGHHGPVSDAAVSVAAASPDPEMAAKLLRDMSMEKAGSAAVGQLTGQLRSDNTNLRAAAATALGSVSASEAPGAKDSLLALYREDRNPGVRKAIVQSLARLGMAGAVPVLESLRGVDPALAPEIDAWVKALKLPTQEWWIVQREKERLRK